MVLSFGHKGSACLFCFSSDKDARRNCFPGAEVGDTWRARSASREPIRVVWGRAPAGSRVQGLVRFSALECPKEAVFFLVFLEVLGT